MPQNTQSYYGRQSFPDFQEEVNALLRELKFHGLKAEFRPFEEEGFGRLAIKGAGRVNPLMLDIAPGYRTPFGEEFKDRTIPGSTIELISRTGWRRVFGPEIWYGGLEEEPELRSPISSFVQYARAAFDPKLQQIYGSTESVWQKLISTGRVGGTGVHVAGGLLQYGPVHPQAAQSEFSSRITVGMGERMDQAQAWRNIYEKAIQSGPTSKWGQLVAYAPWLGDDRMLRMRRVGRARALGEDTGEWQVLGLGQNAADILKRLNVIYQGGLREQAQLFQIDPTGRGLERAEPGYITSMEWSQRAGYKWLNMLMPGETERRPAMVRPGMYLGQSGIYSGSAPIYRDPLAAGYQEGEARSQAYSWGYPSHEQWELNIPHFGRTRQMKFEFGVMRPVYEGEGEERKVVDYKKMRELEGYVLPAGKSAIIGYYEVPGEAGQPATKHPLTVSAYGRQRFFSGTPEWVLPAGYFPTSGKGWSGMEMTKGTQEPVEFAETQPGYRRSLRAILEDKFPGNVRVSGGTSSWLQIPVATQVGPAEKQAVKMAPFEATGVEQLMGDLRVNVGQASAVLSGMTGELKNELMGFMYEFAALPMPQMATMAWLMPGEAGSAMASYIQRLQGRRVPATGGRTELEPTTPVDPERLAKIYAKFTPGVEYEPEVTVYEMFERLRREVEQLDPETSLREFGRARFDLESAPWTPIGFMYPEEKRFLTREAIRGATLGPEGTGEGGVTGLAARQLLRKQIQFQPVYRQGEGASLDATSMPISQRVGLGAAPSGPGLDVLQQQAATLGEQMNTARTEGDIRRATQLADQWQRLQARISATQESVITPEAQGVYGALQSFRKPPNAFTRHAISLLEEVTGRGYGIEGVEDVQAFLNWGERAGIQFQNLGRGQRPMQEARAALSAAFPSRTDPVGYMMSVKQPGLFTTTASAVAPEHLSRMPILGYAELAAINMAYPETAEQIGTTFERGTGATGFRPRHARAWQEIGNIYRYQATKGEEPYIPQERTVLTPELREQLTQQMFAEGQNWSLAELDKFIGGQGPLYNPETGELLERPSTIEDITAWRFRDEEIGEPLNYMAGKYRDALEALIRGESRASGALASMAGQRRIVFRSQARTALKEMGGRYVSTALGGRYAAATGVGLNTAVLTQERMDTMLRQMAEARGVRPTNKLLAGWRRQVEEAGGLPGLVHRFPVLSRTSGSLAMQFVTPEIVKKQTGIDIAEASRVGVGGLIPGSPLATGVVAAFGPRAASFIGDWDYDMAVALGLVDVDPNDPEKLQFKGGRGVQTALAMSAKGTMRTQDQILKAMAGEVAGVPGGELDIFAKGFMDLFYGQPKERGMATASAEEIFVEAQNRLINRGGMGVSYNIARLMEAAGSALGIDPRSVGEGQTAQARSYQEYLDYMGDAEKGFSNVQTMIQSAILTQNKYGDREMRLMAKAGPQLKHRDLWRERERVNFSQRLGDISAQRIAMDVESGTLLPSAAAYMMGTAGTDYESLTKQIQEDPKLALQRLVHGEGYEFTQSPFGLGLMTSIWGKTAGWLGKYPRQIETAEGELVDLLPRISAKSFPWRDDWITTGSLGGQPDIRKTMAYYQDLTMRGGPLDVETTAWLTNIWSQEKGLGHVPNQILQHIVSKYGGLKDVAAVAEQKAVKAAKGLNEIFEEAIPETFRMRGSELAYFAYKPGNIFRGAYSKEMEERFVGEAKEKFVAREVLGMSEVSLGQLFPVKGEYSRAGAELEQMVMRKRVQEGGRFLHKGLEAKGGAVFPMQFFEGQNVTFTGTPDIMGVGPEGYFDITEAKWSRTRASAEARAGSPGVRLQAAMYASGFETLARTSARVGAERGRGEAELFLKGIEPLFETRQEAEAMGQAWFHAIRNKGIRTFVASGYGEGENMQLLESNTGGWFDWQGLVKPSRPGEVTALQRAVQGAQAILNPQSVADIYSQLEGRVAATPGSPSLPSLVGTEIPTSQAGSRLNQPIRAQTENIGPVPTEWRNLDQNTQAMLMGIANLVQQGAQTQTGQGVIPMGGGSGGNVGGGLPNLLNNFMDDQGRLRVHHTHGGLGSSPIEARRRIDIAKTAVGTLMGSERLSGFFERAAQYISGEMGIPLEQIEPFNITEHFTRAFEGEHYEPTRRFIERERETIRQLERQQKLIGRGEQAVRSGLAYVSEEEEQNIMQTFQGAGVVGSGMNLASVIAAEGRAKDMMTGKVRPHRQEELDLIYDKLKNFREAVENTTKVMEKYKGVSQEDLQSRKDVIDAIKKQSIAGLELKSARAAPYIADLQERVMQFKARGEASGISYDQHLEDVEKLAMQEEAQGARQGQIGTAMTKGRLTGRDVSSAMRRLIGGWGLFYMGHLASYPMGQLGYGYQEAQQFGQMAAGYAGAYMGGEVAPFPSIAMAQQRAALRTGGMGMGGIQMAAAQVPPIAHELAGVGMAGLATYGLAAYAGQAMGGTFGGMIGGLAGPLALAAIPATVAMQQYAYRRQPQQTMATMVGEQMIAERETGIPRVLAELGTWYHSGMGKLGDIFGQQLAGGTGTEAQFRMQRAEMYARNVERWLGGETLGTQVDRGAEGFQRFQVPKKDYPVLFQAMAADARFEGLDPTLLYQAAVRMEAGGIAGEDVFRGIVESQQRGVDVPGMANELLGAFRRKATPGGGAGLEEAIQARKLTNYEAEEIRRGAGLIGQLSAPFVQQAFPGEDLISQAEQAARFLRTGNVPLVQRESALAQQAYTLGLERPLTNIPAENLAPAQAAQIFQIQALQSRAMNVGEGMLQAGVGYGTMRQAIQAYGGTFGGVNWMERAMSMEPVAMTQMAMEGAFPGQFRGVSYNQLLGSMMDVNLQGEVTGLPWGTTSFRRGAGPEGAPAAVAAQMWGGNWATVAAQGRPWRTAAVGGLGATYQGREVPEYMQGVGGTRALQWIQRQITRDYQQATSGIQLQQIALQEKYQPQFWAIEDQQRALSHRQAMWGFEYQQQQFEMQGRQFQESMGLQRQQQLMQRGWAREDWAFQDLTRNLQWGWKQEDFQEQVRFMTGRQRKLAERGMERETIMFNLEGEQIDKSRERQEEMWRMQDERHEMTIRHFNEQRELQEENMKKQKEFYEEGRKLEDERIALQRAYWKENIELQKQSVAAQTEYAEQMNQLAEDMAATTTETQDFAGMLRVATSDAVTMANTISRGLNHISKYADDLFKSITDGKGGIKNIPPLKDNNKDPKGPDTPERQAGGHLLPGQWNIVGDRGPELQRLNQFGTVYSLAEVATGLKLHDRWQNELVSSGVKQEQDIFGGGGTIVVNIGNKRLGEFVLGTVQNELEVV